MMGIRTGRFLSAPPTDTYFVGINEYLAAGLSLLWNEEQFFFRDDPRLQMSNNNNTGTWYKEFGAKGGKPAVDLRGWLPGFIDFVGKQEGLIFF
jgi:hypothetical protein